MVSGKGSFRLNSYLRYSLGQLLSLLSGEFWKVLRFQIHLPHLLQHELKDNQTQVWFIETPLGRYDSEPLNSRLNRSEVWGHFTVFFNEERSSPGSSCGRSAVDQTWSPGAPSGSAWRPGSEPAGLEARGEGPQTHPPAGHRKLN